MWETCLHIPLLPVRFKPTHIPEEILTTYLCAGWRTGSPSLHCRLRVLEEEGYRKKENVCVCLCMCVFVYGYVPIKSRICHRDNIYLKHLSLSLTSSFLHIFQWLNHRTRASGFNSASMKEGIAACPTSLESSTIICSSDVGVSPPIRTVPHCLE